MCIKVPQQNTSIKSHEIKPNMCRCRDSVSLYIYIQSVYERFLCLWIQVDLIKAEHLGWWWWWNYTQWMRLRTTHIYIEEMAHSAGFKWQYVCWRILLTLCMCVHMWRTKWRNCPVPPVYCTLCLLLPCRVVIVSYTTMCSLRVRTLYWNASFGKCASDKHIFVFAIFS